MKTILISQCLQYDFIKPIGKYDNLPNLLHIGYDESSRLVGNDITNSPLYNFIDWLNASKNENVLKIHIRDWHKNDDFKQQQHLEKFGLHCIQNTEGAEFVFNVSEDSIVLNSTTLNDFIESDLTEILNKYQNNQVRIGLIGVWTEAKVYFTAYDIVSRYPNFEIAICSALSASSSVHNHYNALDQLSRILNVGIFNSVGQFTNYLSWGVDTFSVEMKNTEFPKVYIPDNSSLESNDYKLLKYVFRNSREVKINILDGGFSGNIVAGTQSIDLNGHKESKHVVKIGQQEEIGRERRAFEIIENVLGNNAPRIVDFADSHGRGIIKYRYASMGNGDSSSFQKRFCNHEPIEKIKFYLDVIFKEQLGKLYLAKTHEKMNLLSYYEFGKVQISNIFNSIANIYKGDLTAANLIIHSHNTPNPLLFYQNDLPQYITRTNMYAFQSYVHGDLNGANIIIDEQENVWIIDFFHTHRGHVLRDLIKIENDLLYIFSELNSEKDFKQALKISKVLFDVTDLQKELPPVEKLELTNLNLIRVYETLCHLRTFYKPLVDWDRNPLQLFIAQLRYSMHTLIFDESNIYQKQWALFNSGHFCELIRKRFLDNQKLRIDYLSSEIIGNHSLAITILPGRKDHSRDLSEDLHEIKKCGIEAIVVLISNDEMDSYGVPTLLKAYKEMSIDYLHQPIVDQKVPNKQDVAAINNFIDAKLSLNKKVLIHCIGGLGRSGLVAACYLKHVGYNSDDAIKIVRNTRSIRAIETKIQEKFIYNY
jgi:protein-tyrosine phosphatase/nicotinamidase-related amidase